MSNKDLLDFDPLFSSAPAASPPAGSAARPPAPANDGFAQAVNPFGASYQTAPYGGPGYGAAPYGSQYGYGGQPGYPQQAYQSYNPFGQAPMQPGFGAPAGFGAPTGFGGAMPGGAGFGAQPMYNTAPPASDPFGGFGGHSAAPQQQHQPQQQPAASSAFPWESNPVPEMKNLNVSSNTAPAATTSSVDDDAFFDFPGMKKTASPAATTATTSPPTSSSSASTNPAARKQSNVRAGPIGGLNDTAKKLASTTGTTKKQSDNMLDWEESPSPVARDDRQQSSRPAYDDSASEEEERPRERERDQRRDRERDRERDRDRDDSSPRRRDDSRDRSRDRSRERDRERDRERERERDRDRDRERDRDRGSSSKTNWRPSGPLIWEKRETLDRDNKNKKWVEWRFALEDGPHIVKLAHSWKYSGKRSILLDDRVVFQQKKFFDTGSSHDFTHQHHRLVVKIIPTMSLEGAPFQYELLVDGLHFTSPILKKNLKLDN